MLAHERQQMILQMMQQTHTIRISEISAQFGVSNETARRDLEYLQKKGFLRRVHGGANLVSTTPPLSDELAEGESAVTVRELLGQAAAELVEENDIIFIGHGTTMREFSRFMPRKRNLTVLTHSLFVINELIDSDVTIYALGGLVDRDEQNMTGTIPISVIQQYFATKAFICCGGVSVDGDVSDFSTDGTLQSLMLQHATKRILVADSGKFGRNTFCKVTQLKELDVIITDNQLPEEFRRRIEQLGIELRLIPIQ